MALGPRNPHFGQAPSLDEEEIRARLWAQRQQQQQQKAPQPTSNAAPQEGENRAFDAKVAALARRKEIIREECWTAFGGQGAPADVGAIPDFDASVENEKKLVKDFKLENHRNNLLVDELNK